MGETDTISRQAAIDAAVNGADPYYKDSITEELINLPPIQPDIAEKLHQYICYITDKEDLQHEVIHTGDIRRVTGWEI